MRVVDRVVFSAIGSISSRLSINPTGSRTAAGTGLAMARYAYVGRCRLTGCPSFWLHGAVILAACSGLFFCAAPRLPTLRAAEDDVAGAAEDEAEGGVSLPTDRLRERQLDRAQRLIEDARWSDAATLLDEILASDRDFFFRPDLRKNNWRSIKTEAARLVGGLPPPGREAYTLQFRSRADRLLKQAIADSDSDGVVAVARRWFHTPAGQQATMLAAFEALEANQPLAAAAWLDRLKSSGAPGFEPTLSVMRAKAWWLAGDRKAAIEILEKVRGGGATTTRIGGRDVSLSLAPDAAAALLESIAGQASRTGDRQDAEWWLHRGDAARNAVSVATRPLLVPRYRVPLTRHPEEARLLEKRRKFFADHDTPLLPAGNPLAVDGLIVLHTPMGLLAVDFETGKRVWLQTGGAAALWADGQIVAEGGMEGVEDAERDETGSMQSAFADATSGTISSNGQFVFAVESDPLEPGRFAVANGLRRIVAAPGRRQGNVLSAYDATAKGALRWRLPLADRPRDEAGAVSDAWYMGAPLTIGDQLFVLVEERGEIRLDVLNAADGGLLWSQPLAELDEDQTADGARARLRRLAGLSPAFAEGVLVCPTGAGAVVAVDLATRTLLWASNYPVPGEQAAQVMRFGVRVQIGGLAGRGGIVVNGPIGGGGPAAGGGWRDAAPILASGRVVLAAIDSEKLQCLDLRTGAAAWEVPRKQALYVAGVIDGRVILVGSHAVEALSLADGKRVWGKPIDLGNASPSGRGIVTQGRLFLPVDTPEVIEIDLRNGSIAGRSPARSGVVPGNLVAYRGEVVSQGVDSLDVFHQAAPLEERIETALKREPPDPWALLWRGQLDLDRGEIVPGMRRIREARAAQPDRIPAEIVGDALLYAMRRDFAAAASVWRETLQSEEELPHSKAMLCLAVDSFLESGDLSAAWKSCQDFLSLPVPQSLLSTGDGASPAESGLRTTNATELLTDASDASLTVSEPRWFQGRLATLRSKASAELRSDIDGFVAVRLRQLLEPATPDPILLGRFVDYFGTHPSAVVAKRALADALDRLLAADPPPTGDLNREWGLWRDLLRLQISETVPEDRFGAGDSAAASTDLGAAWPVGKVVPVRGGRARPEDMQRMSRVIRIPVTVQPGATIPDLRLGYELHTQAFVATDGLGRRIGEPFGFDNTRKLTVLGQTFQAVGAEATVVGPLLIVRSGPLVAAFGLPASDRSGSPAKSAGTPKRLWVISEGTAEVPGMGGMGGMGFALGRVAGGRLRRSGNVPLGMQVSEPDDAQVPGRGVRALAGGVPILVNRSLELRDPISGEVLWQRHRLPVTGDLIGDDAFICVCPRDGKGAVVLSMTDGRIVSTCDMPRHEQRLMTSGRRIVTIEPLSSRQPGVQGVHPKVRLELFDPATLQRQSLGTYAGEARATPVGANMLAVVEPSGSFTVLDLGAAHAAGLPDEAVKIRTSLPDMPASLQQLQVMPWQDRLLVIVGRGETAEEQERFGKLGSVSALPLMTPSEESTPPITGSIWAVSRATGEMLWPVPATIVRHVPAHGQPAALPLMLFARLISPPREGDRQRLSVLCLDKRTGHAVHVDDKIMVQQHVATGCDMIGDPKTHTIAISAGDSAGWNRGGPIGAPPRGNADPAALRLEFTGEPMPPRPPYQASTKPPVTGDLSTELEYWLRKAITIPLPF